MKATASIGFLVSGCNDSTSTVPSAVHTNRRFDFTHIVPGRAVELSQELSPTTVFYIFIILPRNVVHATGFGLKARTIL